MDKVDGATRYIIYRKPNNGSYKKVLTLGGNVYSYTTSIMKPGTYEFIVKAGRYDFIDRLMTQNSNVVKGTSKFTSPTIKLNKTNSNNVKITWNALEAYKYYEVYRLSSNGGSYKKIKTTSVLSYTDKDLKKGNSYYKIKGYRMMNDKKVYGSYSNVKSVNI